MIKREIYKLFVNPLFRIVTLVIIFYTIVFCIYNGFNTQKNVINIKTQGIVSEYYDISDVKELYDETMSEIAALDKDDKLYNYHYKSLNYKAKIYEYLIDNYIPYNELVNFNVIFEDEIDCIYTFHRFISQSSKYIMILYIFLVLYCVLSTDFDNGSYKYLYTKNQRRKTILTKFFVAIASILLLSILILIINTIYACMLFPNENLKVIAVVKNKVVIFTKWKFLFFNSFSVIFNYLFYTFIFSGIFMICKKSIFGILFSALYLVGMNILSDVTSSKILDSFTTSPIYSYFYRDLQYTLTYCIIVGLGLMTIGAIRIYKSDL